jgi:hypothetical protein
VPSTDYLSGTIGDIGEVPDTFLVTNSKVRNGNLMTLVAYPNFQIMSYCHWPPSVTECPRVKKLFFLSQKEEEYFCVEKKNKRIFFCVSLSANEHVSHFLRCFSIVTFFFDKSNKRIFSSNFNGGKVFQGNDGFGPTLHT